VWHEANIAQFREIKACGLCVSNRAYYIPVLRALFIVNDGVMSESVKWYCVVSSLVVAVIGRGMALKY
jgi:disulfide bond formation protein DsbB